MLFVMVLNWILLKIEVVYGSLFFLINMHLKKTSRQIWQEIKFPIPTKRKFFMQKSKYGKESI